MDNYLEIVYEFYSGKYDNFTVSEFKEEMGRRGLVSTAPDPLPCGHSIDHLIRMENGRYFCDACNPAGG